MDNTQWSKEEIAALAKTSGKPLEVSVALAFQKAGWLVELGTYYKDNERGNSRELDVLASKTTTSPLQGIPFVLRILVSCKGFKSESTPVSYSVSDKEIVAPSVSPHFITRCKDWSGEGPVSEIQHRAAQTFLRNSKLWNERVAIAFDVMSRGETKRKPGSDPDVKFVREGDRIIHEGVDSALKAALFWSEHDRISCNNGFVGMYVPVLVSQLPLWNIPIDQGEVGEPALARRAYHFARIQYDDRTLRPVTIVWSVDEILGLIAELDVLYTWFETTCVEREKGLTPRKPCKHCGKL